MFNWFRRNEKAKQQPETTPPETEVEVGTEPDESESSGAEPDYLAYAKAAYKNIQERKGETGQTEEEVEESELVEVTEAETNVVEEVSETENTEVLTKVESVEPVAETAIETEETRAEVESVEPPVEEKPAANVPAWMQKSQGLEKLKETAIASPEPEVEVTETELDEDFIWSSQVLAKSGRAADDVSQEEISWLTKLRQGLGKTRIGLVNQLKSIVGKGPLNDDAVMLD